jgi:hypothetical protein
MTLFLFLVCFFAPWGVLFGIQGQRQQRVAHAQLRDVLLNNNGSSLPFHLVL